MMALIEPEIKEFDAPDPKGKGTHKIVYYQWGDDAAKEVIFCVHGLTRTGRDFDYLASALASSKDVRVIAPDVAGRGKSQWLKKPSWYGYPTYMADMIALIKHLKLEKVKWVGTSMGGLIGILIAAYHPRIISKMVLNDIGPFIPKKSLNRLASYVGKDINFKDMNDASKYLKTIMEGFGITKEEHWNHILKHTFILGSEARYHFAYDPKIAAPFRNILGRPKKMPDMDFSEVWEKVDCPMFVIRGGDSDLLLRETSIEMKEHKFVEEVVELPGIGHAPSLMEEEQIELIEKWL